jgi:hypothetical protein
VRVCGPCWRQVRGYFAEQFTADALKVVLVGPWETLLAV